MHVLLSNSSLFILNEQKLPMQINDLKNVFTNLYRLGEWHLKLLSYEGRN